MALIRAVRDNDVHGVRQCLKNRVDPNMADAGYFAYYPLHFAVLNGNSTIVDILLIGKANVNAENALGDTPLYCALNQGDLVIAKKLIDAGADVNTKCYYETILHLAARRNKLSLMKKLVLFPGVDLNVRDQYGKTPLHTAIASNKDCLEVAKVLIGASEIDLNIKDNVGKTPLHRAVDKGNFELAKILIDAGADANGQDVFKKSVLQQTIDMGNFEFAKILIDAGAKVKKLTKEAKKLMSIDEEEKVSNDKAEEETRSNEEAKNE